MDRERYLREQVHAVITREERSVRQAYVRAFSAEAREFADAMGEALNIWHVQYTAANDDERQVRVLALAYTSISLHVSSMKLLLAGEQLAAGNLMRQVIESIALTLLCTHKALDVLQRFENNLYSTQDAIRDVKRHADELKLQKKALLALEESQKFYSKFSHPSKMTIGVVQSFEGQGIYLGAAFDPGKVEHYKKEVSNRLKLAKLFVGFLQVVERNLAAR